MAVSKDNPLALCRTFFFIPGADERALLAALDGDGDVLVQELEDFTPPARRPEARALAVDILQRWRACGRVSAVRINPFETCGHEDLAAVMAGRPQVVMMSRSSAASR
ncbi:aldolase/citrate lyase family protein [Pseudomonas qingdaonensis]|nr:aldolase/citrate lyase family protein [Pseudomonas qingdaonensis]